MKRLLQLLQNGIRRLERPAADSVFIVLLFALAISAGWLVARHDRYWDWTASASNSLTRETLAILARLDEPLRATVFAAPETPQAKSIDRLLVRYAQALPALRIAYLDPQRFPEQARAADVSLVGQILLEYRSRRATLQAVNERAISAAIAHLSETRTPWIAVIEGHGERAIDGDSSTDLGRFGRELKDHGYLARPLDLTMVKDLPDNTRLALLSTPSIAFFPGEVEGLIRYLNRGGNLLWLLDPPPDAAPFRSLDSPLNGLEPLAAQLGLTILPGVVVDAAAASLGIDTPTVAVIADYPNDALLASHPADSATALVAPAVLPGSLAFAPEVAPGWVLYSYLATGKESWNEISRIAGHLDRDEVVGERPGPLPVILALTRTLPGAAADPGSAPAADPAAGREQRVLVVGDGDFLSNAQLGNHGNRALGMRLLHWLGQSEALPELPPIPRVAAPLILDDSRRLLLGLGALLGLPGLFLGSGLLMRWWRWRGR